MSVSYPNLNRDDPFHEQGAVSPVPWAAMGVLLPDNLGSALILPMSTMAPISCPPVTAVACKPRFWRPSSALERLPG